MEFEITFPCAGTADINNGSCGKRIGLVMNAAKPTDIPVVQCTECGTTWGVQFEMAARIKVSLVKVQ